MKSLFEYGSAAPRRWPPIEKSPQCTLQKKKKSPFAHIARLQHRRSIHPKVWVSELPKSSGGNVTENTEPLEMLNCFAIPANFGRNITNPRRS